ncbi:DNA gyrase subunit A [Gimesia aquarii]|uniref:DNA topoisomerase (ATP-hydrolyzing) n=1 Tax=Gimesia aquarii TaxID=2527964 RepID=A0A517VY42_9PLAN|nr:DNA gyrase subunit A [Gimesia aquarii]QDT97911.1 DNA gyrase subunit A [Gimesia aquarii]
MASDNGEESNTSENIKYLDIQDEMRDSYLTYAMSVIISRALPDARDGLKPSQRRILVAMNDLNLGSNSSRVKCAKISGDTSGNYHPHGDGSIYPTLVRLGQEWVMRNVLIDKQGNFGSLAGLPPAAMRYTEARLAPVAAEMLDDINRNTVDFVPTYDQRNNEPVVLPAKFPNLLVNGSSGIAVGMATSIPPQNMGEVCDAVTLLIDNPDATVDDILQVMPGPDFPTGGVICGRYGIRKGYATGRSTITLRARTHFETEKQSDVIVVTEIPYMETRDRIREKLETLVRDDRVKGISRIVDLTDRNVPPWKVHLQIILKRDADKEVVLAQLFKFSPLQSTFSIILLALVGNRPETLSVKELLQQFIIHRIDVIRRRTEFLLAEARKRKHTVEGLMIAQIDIDEVIKTIRNSPSRAEAKISLQGMQVDGKLIERALGEEGFKEYQNEQGVHEYYSLSANQAEAIVSMQLGSLANLEREKLSDEHKELLKAISGYLYLLSDEDHIRAVIHDDMLQLKQKYADKRRTDISDEELTDVNRDDLIAEEPMVVTLSQRGYIKRTQLNTYQAQNRGGKGVKGAKTDDEDPIQHLFVASTHSYLLFITNRGRVYWQKVYDLPLQGRTAKGRALVNLLTLQEDETVSNCVAVREFDEERFLVMATRNGIIKKSPLSAYSRPQRGGIIAIKLDEEDELVEALIVSPGEDLLLATSDGMSIRFAQSDARSMGRNTRGVKGIKLSKTGHVIGMVIADPDACLLTVCENGFGKRTPFGFIPDNSDSEEESTEPIEDDITEMEGDVSESDIEEGSEDETETRSGMQYRRQKRGGKGVRDIRTSKRNGQAVDIIPVAEDDEVLMVTSSGKIQRVRGREISQVGRNTQGVRVIKLDDNDKLVSLARIPAEIVDAPENGAPANSESPTEIPEADQNPENDSKSSQ